MAGAAQGGQHSTTHKMTISTGSAVRYVEYTGGEGYSGVLVIGVMYTRLSLVF